jgi:hypothetical protein
MAVNEAMATAEDGALPHRFLRRDLFDNRLSQPWYSARTQGLMLSALVRLYEVDRDQAWLTQAKKVFAALTRVRDYGFPPPVPWMSFVDGGGHLWFEELADGGEPSMLVQGHLSALLGIYDLWRVTRSPQVQSYFYGGVATIRSVLPSLRAANAIMLSSPRVHTRDPRAHPVITRQVRTLAQITDDPRLSRYARLLAQDLNAVEVRERCAADPACRRLSSR